MTVVAPRIVKGAYLHRLGRVTSPASRRISEHVASSKAGHQCFLSGEGHDYLSVEIPVQYELAIQNTSPGLTLLTSTSAVSDAALEHRISRRMTRIETLCAG